MTMKNSWIVTIVTLWTTTTITGVSADCSSYTDCVPCVEASCAFSDGACYDSCDLVSAVTDCYAVDNFVGLNGPEICAIGGFTGDATVTTTAAPTDTDSSEQDMNITDIGGSATIGEEEEEVAYETEEEVEEIGYEEEEEMKDDTNMTMPESTGNYTDPCNGLPTCENCLNVRMACVWTAGSCERDCIADADCWSPTITGYSNMTGPEICAIAEETGADIGVDDVAEEAVSRSVNSAGQEATSAANPVQLVTSLVALMSVVALVVV